MNHAFANCRACGARIIWARTPNNRRAPLDATPEKRAILEERGANDAPLVRVVDVYTSHFAGPTAPDGKNHATRRRRAGVLRCQCGGFGVTACTPPGSPMGQGAVVKCGPCGGALPLGWLLRTLEQNRACADKPDGWRPAGLFTGRPR